jgi:N6-adenosine-specific RNA methylase IME4
LWPTCGGSVTRHFSIRDWPFAVGRPVPTNQAIPGWGKYFRNSWSARARFAKKLQVPYGGHASGAGLVSGIPGCSDRGSATSGLTTDVELMGQRNAQSGGENCMDLHPSQTDQNYLTAIATDPEKTIVFISRAIDALSESNGIEEVKQYHDKAEAIRTYARCAGMEFAILNGLAEMKLRSEREGGRLLKDMQLHGGKRSRSLRVTLRLSDLGITRNQSVRWQRVAAVPESCFHEYLTACKNRIKAISAAGLLRFAEKCAAPAPSRRFADFVSIATALQQLVARGEKYSCIYVNPPWPDGTSCVQRPGDLRRVETARAFARELKRLPLRHIGGVNCHLHLRAPTEHLLDAMTVLRGWGYAYGGVLVWRRPTPTYGAHWQASLEFLILGIRGRAPFRDNGASDWLDVRERTPGDADRAVTRLIESTSPTPRLELFGVQPRPGWNTVLSTRAQTA